jgi:SAF domain
MTAATTDRPTTSAATTPGVFGRRRSRMTMVGVLLAIVGGLVAWFAYSQATQGVEVIATARHIAYGARITEADVQPVEIPAGSTLRATAWSDRGTVVGQVATTDLPPGTLVPPDAVGAARLPVRGEAIVGLPIGAGRLPVSGLLPRDVVQIVQPATAQTGQTGQTGLRATVLAIGDPDAAGRRTVDLIVPDTAVDDVAAAAGNDNTLLVLLGSGG